MSFSKNLKKTADRLLATYGNTVTISSTPVTGSYNPQTGRMETGAPITHTKKASNTPLTSKELATSGLPENMWSSISAIYTFVEDAETTLLDNTWSVDGVKIRKVLRIKAQDTSIILKVYVGA